MTQAYAQLQEGRFEEAVDTFSASLAVGPRTIPALRGRGQAYGQLQRWSLAAADFEAAKDLAPDDADNWVDWGISLANNQQMYPAIDAFDALLAKHPTCVRGHLELGRLYLTIGAIPKGRQQLEQALACHPMPEQRHIIDTLLREQQKLDKKRIYRPDFESLHRTEQQTGPASWFRRLRGFLGRGGVK